MHHRKTKDINLFLLFYLSDKGPGWLNELGSWIN